MKANYKTLVFKNSLYQKKNTNLLNKNPLKFFNSKEINKNKNLLNSNSISYHNLSQKNLLSIQKKGAFNKSKGIYENLKDTIKNKKEDWVELEEPLYFKDQKYLIIEVEPSYRNSIVYMEKYLLFPGKIIFGSLSVYFLYCKRYFSFIFSFFTYLLFTRMNRGIKVNNKKMIDKIYLMENGTEVMVNTFDDTFITDIKNIRKLEVEEGLYLTTNLNTIHKNYVPISINQKLYIIPKRSITLNKEILNAISQGKYIKFDESVNSEESIDISDYNNNQNESFIDIEPNSEKEKRK